MYPLALKTNRLENIDERTVIFPRKDTWQELVVEVVLPVSIKPLPMADLLSSAWESRRVAMLEEAPVTGGWGGEVAARVHEELHDRLLAPVKRFGSLELPIPSAPQLERRVLPSQHGIEAAIRDLMI